MMKPRSLAALLMVAGSLAGLLLSGCASTAPTARFDNGKALVSPIKAKDKVTAKVEAMPGVEILEVEKSRLSQRIEERINAKKILNASDASQGYVVEVKLSRYEKGNAFARAMLIGLGQIHIDARVRLLNQADNSVAGEFDIKKTFAWGGAYGAATSMEDIERTFADGIAAALTGQKEDSTKKSG